jgi:hypothetical protein
MKLIARGGLRDLVEHGVSIMKHDGTHQPPKRAAQAHKYSNGRTIGRFFLRICH